MMPQWWSSNWSQLKIMFKIPIPWFYLWVNSSLPSLLFCQTPMDRIRPIHTEAVVGLIYLVYSRSYRNNWRHTQNYCLTTYLGTLCPSQVGTWIWPSQKDLFFFLFVLFACWAGIMSTALIALMFILLPLSKLFKIVYFTVWLP